MRKHRAAFAFTLAATLPLLLAHPACAQTPGSPLPGQPVPVLHLEAQMTPPPAPAAASSKPGTTPLTRQQAEQIALQNNPRIRVATLLALAQNEIVRETRSAELPSLAGNITAEKSEEGTRLASGSLSSSRLLDHAGGGITLNQLITDFGRTRNLIASSSLQARAAGQTTLATREEILLATDLAFYAALEAQATLKVAQSTVAARTSVNQQISALTASKLKSTLDQSFAEVNLSQAQLLSLDAENQANAAFATLNEVLGTTAGTHYQLVDDTGTPPALATTSEAAVAQALAQRPDLAAQKLTHQADLRFAKAQWDQLLPTLSVLGAVGGIPWDPNTSSNTYFVADWYGAAAANLSIPIFNGFKLHAQAHEADFRARASDQQSRELEDRIARDVRTAWLEANTAQQRMAVTHQLLTQANTALDLAQTRYNLGLSSIVELSQAQLQQTQAQIDDANARFEYEADLAKLRFQTGTQP